MSNNKKGRFWKIILTLLNCIYRVQYNMPYACSQAIKKLDFHYRHVTYQMIALYLQNLNRINDFCSKYFKLMSWMFGGQVGPPKKKKIFIMWMKNRILKFIHLFAIFSVITIILFAIKCTIYAYTLGVVVVVGVGHITHPHLGVHWY